VRECLSHNAAIAKGSFQGDEELMMDFISTLNAIVQSYGPIADREPRTFRDDCGSHAKASTNTPVQEKDLIHPDPVYRGTLRPNGKLARWKNFQSSSIG